MVEEVKKQGLIGTRRLLTKCLSEKKELQEQLANPNNNQCDSSDLLSQKEAAENKVAVLEGAFKAATEGVKVGENIKLVKLNVEDLEKFVQIFKGNSTDIESSMQQHIANFCQLNNGDGKVVNPEIIKYAATAEQHMGIDVPNLIKFCTDNQNLLPGFQAADVPQTDSLTGVTPVTPEGE